MRPPFRFSKGTYYRLDYCRRVAGGTCRRPSGATAPEQLATLMRRLEGDRNGHSGEGVRLWDKPTRNVEPC